MAGILESIDNLLGTRLGLLVSDPRAAIQQMNQQAGAFNQASLLATQAERNAMRGRPVTPEQAAAKQYVDKVNEDLAMGFAGTVGSAPRSLPLRSYGEIQQFSKPLPKGELYRELNFDNLFTPNMPFGAPITHFAEVPEMALGQGNNKGIMIKVNSEGLVGRPYLGKPGLEQAYLERAGEFQIKDQPSNIKNAITEIWISPDAYKGMRKSQKQIYDMWLENAFGKKGIKINRVEKLPNVIE